MKYFWIIEDLIYVSMNIKNVKNSFYMRYCSNALQIENKMILERVMSLCE